MVSKAAPSPAAAAAASRSRTSASSVAMSAPAPRSARPSTQRLLSCPSFLSSPEALAGHGGVRTGARVSLLDQQTLWGWSARSARNRYGLFAWRGTVAPWRPLLSVGDGPARIVGPA